MPWGEQPEIVYNNNEVTIADENTRGVTINLNFLSQTFKYKVILYTDGKNA